MWCHFRAFDEDGMKRKRCNRPRASSWRMMVAASSMVLAFVLLGPDRVAGEIMKIVLPACRGQVCFIWWPKIDAPAGYHHDEPASRRFRFNAFAPDGSSFADAETVMYARACYKPR